MDQVTELEQELRARTPEENIRSEVYAQVTGWVGKSYKKQLLSALSEKRPDLKTHQRLAQLQYDYVRVMWACRELADFNQRQDCKALDTLKQNIHRIMLSGSNSIVQTVKTEDMRGKIESHIVGTLTTLKFLDLFHGSLSDGFGERFRGALRYNVEDDVINKVDLEFRFGDRNPQTGKEIVRLIQLKTAGDNNSIAVARLTSSYHIPDNVFEYISVNDTEILLDHAKTIERENPDIEVRVFAAAIPCVLPTAHGSPDNVLGIGIDNTPQGLDHRRLLIQEFSRQAEAAGLLPLGRR